MLYENSIWDIHKHTMLNHFIEKHVIWDLDWKQPQAHDVEICLCIAHSLNNVKAERRELTPLTAVTFMKRLWSGEHASSQNRFKKFRKHAGQPVKNGTACANSTICEASMYRREYYNADKENRTLHIYCMGIHTEEQKRPTISLRRD